MKNKLISILVLLSLTLPVSAGAVGAGDFTDVQPSDWYYEAVEYVAANGLFNGTSATTFSPDAAMTRGMFVTVLGRMSQVPDSYGRTQTTPFSDVTQVDYFFPYTVWANDNDIVNGIGNGLFNPHGEVTREQAATILYRYAEKFGIDTGFSPDNFDAFSDTSSVSSYAITAVQWAVAHEILSGDNGILAPQVSANRAQVAQAFMKLSILAEAPPTNTEAPTDWENYNPTYAAPTGKSVVDASGGYYDYDLGNEIMAQVNALREASGLDALLYHPKIQEWAAIRAMEQTILRAHTRPNGSDCLSVGIGLDSENLAWITNYTVEEMSCQQYAENVVAWWSGSESHRRGMLKPSANLGAVSCYVRGDAVYITHLFSMHTLYHMDYLI